VREGSKYQLLLRTSNPGALVLMGKMIANEGGAITCKFNSSREDNTATLAWPGGMSVTKQLGKSPYG
jgi:hypothetical protein